MVATRRRRLAPEERRAHIIRVSTSLVAEAGYNAFTLSELATRCGMTRAGITHHFASKEEIFVEVLRLRDEEDLAAQGFDELDLPRTRDGFRLLLSRLASRNLTQIEIVRLYTILSAEALSKDHPAHEYFLSRMTRSRRALSRIAGEWHPDPDRLTVEILSYMDGLQLNWLRDPTIDFAEMWEAFADRLLSPDDARPGKG